MKYKNTPISINQGHSLISEQREDLGESCYNYINDKIGQNVELINSISSEDRIWIKYRDSSSRGNDIYICFCYIPPKDSTVMCNEESQWSTFESEVVRFSIKGSILICGDMNTRTGNMSDFIQNDSEIPIHSPLTYVVDKEFPRTSKDMSVNAQGRCLLDMCISSRLRIMNGRHRGTVKETILAILIEVAV